MDPVNEYLKSNGDRDSSGEFYFSLPVVCQDGFKMSVQASKYHYCTPRETGAFPYDAVEIGFPNRREPLLADYAENRKRLTKTVYGYVPIVVVNKVVEKHGGIKAAA